MGLMLSGHFKKPHIWFKIKLGKSRKQDQYQLQEFHYSIGLLFDMV